MPPSDHISRVIDSCASISASMAALMSFASNSFPLKGTLLLEGRAPPFPVHCRHRTPPGICVAIELAHGEEKVTLAFVVLRPLLGVSSIDTEGTERA